MDGYTAQRNIQEVNKTEPQKRISDSIRHPPPPTPSLYDGRLRVRQDHVPIPPAARHGHLGYNVEPLTINGIEINIRDFGGDWNYRHGIWRHFVPGADGIIFVVDSSDESQIDATKIALHKFYRYHEAQLKRSVLLVFANKQDRLDALSVAEARDRIGIGIKTM